MITVKIMDDNGHLWHFDKRKMKIVCDGDRSSGGGYYCDDVFEGLDKLIEEGYIAKNQTLVIGKVTK